MKGETLVRVAADKALRTEDIFQSASGETCHPATRPAPDGKGISTMSDGPTIFTVQSNMLLERRLDPEYHFARLNTSVKSPYPLVKLLSLAHFKTGGTPSTGIADYWGGSLPWVSAKDFKTFRFEDSEDHITEKAAREATTYVVDKPALLMVSRSGILQHSLPVMVTYKRTAINQDIKAFFPDNRATVDYLGAYFDLMGPRLLPLLCKSGATVQSLNTNELLNLQIPVPSLDVQKRIVEELDAAYATKRKADEKAARLLSSIDDIVLSELGIPPLPPQDDSLAARMFTVPASELFENRMDAVAYQGLRRQFLKSVAHSRYPNVRLDALVDVNRLQTDELNGRRYVGLENIDGVTGRFVPTQDKEKISSAVVFKEGDILFPKLRPYLNKVWLAMFDGAASTEFYPLRSKDVDAGYLTAYLRTKAVVDVMTILMTGNTLPRVQLEDVLSLPVPVPPLDIQSKIVEQVIAIHKEAEQILVDANKRLATLKIKVEKELVQGEFK